MNTKFKLLAVTAISMTSPSSAAYAGAIKAQVTDAGNTASMRAAEIRINKLDRAAITERDGSSSFTGIAEGGSFRPHSTAGLFDAQDDDNRPHAQIFKLLSWRDILGTVTQ